MNSYMKMLRKYVGSQRVILPGIRAIIVNEAGEILLQRRTDMPLWGLPGGVAEIEETALEALKREVAEETSLEVIEAEPMALYSGPGQRFSYPNGDKVQSYALCFIVRKWEGQPRHDGVEGSQVRFFTLSNLPEDILPIHRQTLDDYSRYEGKFLVP